MHQIRQWKQAKRSSYEGHGEDMAGEIEGMEPLRG